MSEPDRARPGAPVRFGVLAVCTANICRSPMVEIMLRDRLAPARFEVASAGVLGWNDAPMDEMAERELARFGLDGSGFRSHPLSTYLVESADVIVTATRDHRSRILEDDPRALRWTFTLRELAGLCEIVPDDVPDLRTFVSEAARARHRFTGDPDVQDPYRGGPELHRATADLIHQSVAVVADRLNSFSA